MHLENEFLYVMILPQIGGRKAIETLSTRKFQPWEGGEGQALGQHVRTHLALGRQALASGDAANALTHFQQALDIPENLGESWLSLKIMDSITFGSTRGARRMQRSLRRTNSGCTAAFTAELSGQLRDIDQKLDRLMAAYLGNAISLSEYQIQKNKLLEVKQQVKDKTVASTEIDSTWFEPAIRFVKASSEAIQMASSDDLEEIKTFLEKTGSNFHLKGKRLSITPRDEWELVANQRDFATTPVFGMPAPVGAAPETGNFVKWRRGWDSVKDLLVSRLTIH